MTTLLRWFSKDGSEEGQRRRPSDDAETEAADTALSGPWSASRRVSAAKNMPESYAPASSGVDRFSRPFRHPESPRNPTPRPKTTYHRPPTTSRAQTNRSSGLTQ